MEASKLIEIIQKFYPNMYIKGYENLRLYLQPNDKEYFIWGSNCNYKSIFGKKDEKEIDNERKFKRS